MNVSLPFFNGLLLLGILLCLPAANLYASESANEKKLAALGAGESLLSGEGDPLLQFIPRDIKGDHLQLVRISDPDNDQSKLIVQVKKRPEKDWHVTLNTKPKKPLARGDVVLLSFWAKATHATTEQNEASINIQLIGTKPKRDYWIVHDVSIPSRWKQFYVGGRVGGKGDKTSFTPDEVLLTFLLGRSEQTVEFRDLALVRYPKEIQLAELPVTVETWAGREADAPWRKAAEARIEKIRKGDLTVTVLDAAGKPVPDATVSVEMQRHAFYFGTAVNAHYIADLPDKPNMKRLREEFLRNFNCAVMENSLKMPQWKENPDRARKAVAWLREQSMPVRGHNLVWPSWKWLPKELQAMEEEPEKVRAYVRDHMKEIATDMRGQLIHWDVNNEPFHNHDLMDLLGEDEVIEWFKIAHKADPEARLYMNECQVLATAGQIDTQQQQNFERWIKKLQDAGAPIGGIGFQSHFGNIVTDPETVLKILDRFETLGLPMAITEFDHATSDEQAQADFMRDFLTATFSHPGVDTFMMWGFWDGWHWKKNAPLFRKDWSLKPSGQVWRDLIYKQWWTDETLTTDKQGVAQTRGFFGDYVIKASANGQRAQKKLTLSKDGATVTLRLGE